MSRLAPVAIAGVVVGVGVFGFLAARGPSPERVAADFLRARYVNDAQEVYALASAADRRYRTLEQHRESHPPFPADYQELIEELARFIEIRTVDAALQPDRGLVTVHGSLPNANHPQLANLLYGDGGGNEGGAGAAAAGASHRVRGAAIRKQGRAGDLPTIEFTEQVELVRDREAWRVYLDWATGHTVNFAAEVREQLPFSFTVEPASVILKPGETATALFRARNLSDRTVKAKAGHLFHPPVAYLHTELLQCFCFFEDTFAPGEEKELPVALRLGWDIPPDATEITMLYEYYPLEQFLDRRPAAAGSSGGSSN